MATIKRNFEPMIILEVDDLLISYMASPMAQPPGSAPFWHNR